MMLSSSFHYLIQQEAINMNNNGIVDLRNGNYKYAVESLKRSLTLMKHELSSREVVGRRNQQKSAVTAAAAAAAPHHLPPLTQMKRVPVVSSSNHCCDDQRNSNVTIFSQAFVFSMPSSNNDDVVRCDDDDDDALQVEQPDNMHIGSILFNLALVYHHYNYSHLSKMKAFKLYGMVLQLLDDACFADLYEAVLLKLACINNMIHLQQSHHINDDDDVDVFQFNAEEHIANIINQSSDPSLWMGDPEVLGLLMNVTYSQVVPTIASAA